MSFANFAYTQRMSNRRWMWQGELWSDDWMREFMWRRDLSGRHMGTIKAASRNYIKNREAVPCNSDFLDACYGDHGRSTHKTPEVY